MKKNIKFKRIIVKYRLLLFYLIVVFIFLTLLISNYLYYLNLERKGNFILYENISYVNIDEIDYNIKFNQLDIYVPKEKSDKKYPVMIYAHGGGWSEPFGSKESRNKQILKGIYYTDRNFILVNINYRLYPHFNFPAFPEDVASAIAWVYNNIEDYNGNKDFIFLKGHSAGAQISSLVATDQTYLQNNGLDLDVLKGVILFEGVGYDILKARNFDIDSILVNRYLMFPFGEKESVLKNASPVNHIEPNKNIPPIILFAAENTIFRIAKIEAFDFYLRLIENDVYARYFIVSGKNHSTLNRDFGIENDFTTLKTQEFIDSILINRGYFS